jgi:hypothetical protein
MCEDFDRNLHLRFDLQFRPQISDADDQILQDRHLGLRREIVLRFVCLRETSQRN